MKTANGFVPFCAAGLSYSALLTYFRLLSETKSQEVRKDELRKLMPDLEHYFFYPTVSCVDMYHVAAGKRRWIDNKPESVVPKPGWIVLYDWDKRGVPDHCGLVQAASGTGLVSVEFSTSTGKGSQKNGGLVAERKRSYEYVRGYINTQ